MRRTPALTGLLAVAVAAVSGAQPPAPSRLEAVAETRLLMEGLNQANFRGLERLLRQRPADPEAWVFIRGQALLIAETGNLLMLRPPRNQGQAVWMERSAELRSVATRLAREAANQDYVRSRAILLELAQSCNRCHQTFRIPVRLTPFTDPASPAGTTP
ncbi:MAG: hypothetical protein NZ700_13460 [Gemmataceae bacterium]|nr:hypothetical protein [Gemmataceae bacterium]MDW8265182.1 hypothetical protein [Gemmataceae bacterium]